MFSKWIQTNYLQIFSVAESGSDHCMACKIEEFNFRLIYARQKISLGHAASVSMLTVWPWQM